MAGEVFWQAKVHRCRCCPLAQRPDPSLTPAVLKSCNAPCPLPWPFQALLYAPPRPALGPACAQVPSPPWQPILAHRTDPLLLSLKFCDAPQNLFLPIALAPCCPSLTPGPACAQVLSPP